MLRRPPEPKEASQPPSSTADRIALSSTGDYLQRFRPFAKLKQGAPTRSVYDVRMSSQIFTLMGVVAGALATYLATSASDKSRFKRELTTRWDDRRLQAFVDYNEVRRNTPGERRQGH